MCLSLKFDISNASLVNATSLIVLKLKNEVTVANAIVLPRIPKLFLNFIDSMYLKDRKANKNVIKISNKIDIDVISIPI
ncbi:hypothetical protein GCM10028808_53840 [Spirosoma migulaei]